MTAAAVPTQALTQTTRWLAPSLRTGAIAAISSLYLSLVGIVANFHERPLIDPIISVGQTALALTALAAGFVAASRVATRRDRLLAGVIAGGLSGISLSLLVLLGSVINLRSVFLEATTDLYDLLSFGLGVAGFWLPIVIGAVLGLVGAAAFGARTNLRRALIIALVSLLVFGLFAALLRQTLLSSAFGDFGRLLFAGAGGLTIVGAIVTLAGTLGYDLGARIGRRAGSALWGRVGGIIGGVVVSLAAGYLTRTLPGFDPDLRLVFQASATLIGAVVGLVVGALLGAMAHRVVARGQVGQRLAVLPEGQQRSVRLAVRVALIAVAVLIILWLPIAVGPLFAIVVVTVALYILMGLGLNITLGLAGLLDLGFVAFFAVGSYTVALLTSTGEYGIAQWPFWAAVPVAVLLAMAFGAFFGLPILGIRGDYLAIATLGFGEIVAILAESNLLLPLLGGPRGITNVPPPISVPPTDPLAGPVQIYYVALACAAVVAFIAYRLRESRLGRAWLAIREDEDVAEAMGVNLVQTKLLAYMLGAAFAGLGGAIFAGLLGAAFPGSINLLVSINVAAVIIVGGMGSIPGVIVGAIFLIGLPELFRQFQEYRLLFYGMALILVMRFRPEGLLPSRAVQRELHQEAENVAAADAGADAVVAKIEAGRA